MNAIELLKEARGASIMVLDGLNARIDRASKQGEPIPVYDGIVELHELIGKINAYLATPAPDAMGLVEKIRGFSACILQRKPSMRTDNDPGEVEKISTDWMLSEVEAAALIESYGRRVPMKMLTEIFNNAVDWVPIGDSERVDEIAAEYGVKVEG